MLKKILLIVVLLIIVGLVLVYYMMSRGPDPSQFEHLKTPRIASMPDQKMIIIELKGDPNVVGKKVFKKLYKTFYKLKIKDKKMVAPRARWSVVSLSKENWIGYYGLPVPESVAELPADINKKGPEVRLETWNYGEVAEVLYVGPYSEEGEAIAKLAAFIEENGYRIKGLHEEEYLKGPGFWPVNPKDYLTIIRYTIEKMETPQPDI